MPMIPAIITGIMSMTCALVIVSYNEHLCQLPCQSMVRHELENKFRHQIDVLLTIKSGLKTPIAEIPTPDFAVP